MLVCESNENVFEIIPQSIEFRHFEMKDKIMCLNGKQMGAGGGNSWEHKYCLNFT